MERIWYDDIIHNRYDGQLLSFFAFFFTVTRLVWTCTLLLLLNSILLFYDAAAWAGVLTFTVKILFAFQL